MEEERRGLQGDRMVLGSASKEEEKVVDGWRTRGERRLEGA